MALIGPFHWWILGGIAITIIFAWQAITHSYQRNNYMSDDERNELINQLEPDNLI